MQNVVIEKIYLKIYFSAGGYLFIQGNGGWGRELSQREGKRGNQSQSWVENTMHD
jgi:hypothetical protein